MRPGILTVAAAALVAACSPIPEASYSMTMQPVRYSNPITLTCEYPDAGGLERCLEDTTRSVAQGLRQQFAGRAQVSTDVSLFTIQLTLIDPLVQEAGEPQSEYVLTAEVMLRVRDIFDDQAPYRVRISPEIVARISRRENDARWSWAVTDSDDKLGSFLMEVEDVLETL